MPWTEITRREYCRDRLRYASDLTDEKGASIALYLPEPRRFGRPRTTDLRAVIEAILYISSTGCQWRMLAWLNRNRRLAKDFAATIESAKAWLMIARIKLMVRRLARA